MNTSEDPQPKKLPGERKEGFYEFPLPIIDSGQTVIAKAWAKVPPALPVDSRRDIRNKIKKELKKGGAVLVAHYYVDGDIQDLALETGGVVADSLEMARFGRDSQAKCLIVAGVRFMGESAKILNPEKTILMPDIEATCSLDLGCPEKEFAKFRSLHPDRCVVVYANTSAAIKAQADWMVTSSCAFAIISHLHENGIKTLWAPDRHLGEYIKRQTQADMVIWDGACIVHDEFKGEELAELRKQNPGAVVLVHPESPDSVVSQANVVGSTTALLNAVINSDAREFIVATDQGLVHRMKHSAPDKKYIAAPTSGESATCKSCAYCPWMAMNSLQGILRCLEDGVHEIEIDEQTRINAIRPIDRMLEFTKQHEEKLSSPQMGFVENIGAV